MTGSFAITTAATTAQIAETEATVAQGVAIAATSTATSGATIAMKLFRLALIATGIGAIIVGIGFLIANMGSLLSLFSDSAEANARNAAAVKANTIEIEKNVKANDKRSASLKTSNDYQYAMAKATGATNDQLREMAVRHAQSTIEMEKNSIAIATQIYWKNKLKLQQLINADADEEDIKNQRKNAEEAHKALAKEQKDYHDALSNKKAVIRQNNIEIAAENYEANKKEKEQLSKHHTVKHDIIKKAGKTEQELAAENAKKLQDIADKAAADAEAKRIKDFQALQALTKEQNDFVYRNERGFETAKIIANENDFKAKKALLLIEKDQLLTDLKLGEGEKAAIIAKYTKDLEELEKQKNTNELAAAKTLRNQKLQAVQDGFNTIANLAELFAGKNRKQQKAAFNIQKAANLASATIDTYRAVMSTYASTPGGPIIKGIAAGVSLTAGLINVKKIASTTFEGGGGGSAAGGGGGGGSEGGGGGGSSTPAAPQNAPNFNLVGATGLNQLDMLGQPIQAFVVGGEVTTYQELERNRLRNATL
jgi:hypothetical protein